MSLLSPSVSSLASSLVVFLGARHTAIEVMFPFRRVSVCVCVFRAYDDTHFMGGASKGRPYLPTIAYFRWVFLPAIPVQSLKSVVGLAVEKFRASVVRFWCALSVCVCVYVHVCGVRSRTRTGRDLVLIKEIDISRCGSAATPFPPQGRRSYPGLCRNVKAVKKCFPLLPPTTHGISFHGEGDPFQACRACHVYIFGRGFLSGFEAFGCMCACVYPDCRADMVNGVATKGAISYALPARTCTQTHISHVFVLLYCLFLKQTHMSKAAWNIAADIDVGCREEGWRGKCFFSDPQTLGFPSRGL